MSECPCFHPKLLAAPIASRRLCWPIPFGLWWTHLGHWLASRWLQIWMGNHCEFFTLTGGNWLKNCVELVVYFSNSQTSWEPDMLSHWESKVLASLHLSEALSMTWPGSWLIKKGVWSKKGACQPCLFCLCNPLLLCFAFGLQLSLSQLFPLVFPPFAFWYPANKADFIPMPQWWCKSILNFNLKSD